MGILQARILEWVAMPSSRGSSQLRDQTQVSCIVDRFFITETPGKPKNTGVGSLSLLQRSFQPRNQTGVSCIAGGAELPGKPTISWNLLQFLSTELVISNHLILSRPLLFLSSIFPSTRLFSNESALHIRWPKFWSVGFSIS